MVPHSRKPAPIDIAHGSFVNDAELRELVTAGAIRRRGHTIALETGELYVIVAAVRILGCHEDGSDPFGLTGVVHTLQRLVKTGFALKGDIVVLQRIMYDVEHGFFLEKLGDITETGTHPLVKLAESV